MSCAVPKSFATDCITSLGTEDSIAAIRSFSFARTRLFFIASLRRTWRVAFKPVTPNFDALGASFNSAAFICLISLGISSLLASPSIAFDSPPDFAPQFELFFVCSATGFSFMLPEFFFELAFYLFIVFSAMGFSFVLADAALSFVLANAFFSFSFFSLICFFGLLR